MKYVLTLSIILLLFLSACSVEMINQKSVAMGNEGYLVLTGSLNGKEVIINEEPVNVGYSQKLGLKSGTYNLQILSSGKLLLKRSVFITAGQIVEVSVP